MAIDNSKLTAAPMELKLGDKTFLMSPMTDKMHSEMNNFARQKHIRSSVEAVQGMDLFMVREVIKTVTEESHALEWNNPPLSQMFRNVDSVAYLMWVSVKPTDRKVTLDKVEKALLDGDPKLNAREFFRVYNELNTINVKNSEAPEE